MKTEPSILKWRTPDGFLSKATLDQLIPHSKISHFPAGSVVCTGDQLTDCVYLVLSGRCELHHRFGRNGDDGAQIFETGQSFGGETDGSLPLLDWDVVSLQDSVVLAMQKADLDTLETNGFDVPNGHAEQPDSDADHGTSFYFNTASHRIISFVFLGDSLPVGLLSEKIAGQLHVETGQPVILVEFDQRGGDRAAFRTGFDYELDSAASLPGNLHRDASGMYRLRLKLPNLLPDPEVVGELFRKLRRRFRFVIAAMTAEQLPGSYLFSSVSHSDSAHFFLRSDTEDLYELDLLLHELRPRLNQPGAVELKAVLCLEKDEKVGDFDGKIASTGIASPSFIRECPPWFNASGPAAEGALLRTDIRYLARSIGKCLVGLAMSSGGAKGLAHIGVIQVLEENNIEVDVIAGASMGAYVGSIWACGQPGDKLEQLAREMEVKWSMWTLLDPVVIPRQGFMRGLAVKRRLQKTIGSAQFTDLTRTLRVVAAQLDTMERIVFSTGDVATAVHASIAVPGICIPVQIGDEFFVDGGLVDPLPADVLQEMGVNKIIAVNTIPTPERIRYCMQLEHELSREVPVRHPSFFSKLLPHRGHVNHYAHSNILDILMHSTHGAQMRMAENGARRASVVLHPDICDDRWLDFRNPGFYIQAGREVALRHLDEIKALIKTKGASYEHQPSPHPLAQAVA